MFPPHSPSLLLLSFFRHFLEQNFMRLSLLGDAVFCEYTQYFNAIYRAASRFSENTNTPKIPQNTDKIPIQGCQWDSRNTDTDNNIISLGGGEGSENELQDEGVHLCLAVGEGPSTAWRADWGNN